MMEKKFYGPKLPTNNLTRVNIIFLGLSILILIMSSIQVKAADDDYLRRYILKGVRQKDNIDPKKENLVTYDLSDSELAELEHNEGKHSRLDQNAIKLMILLKYLNNKKNTAKRPECHLGLGMGYLCHAYSISKLSAHQNKLSHPKSPGK